MRQALRTPHGLALAVVLAVAAAVRLVGLGAQSFWCDEAATLLILEAPPGQLLGDVSRQESTPPLFYVLARAWVALFGTGEAAVRVLPALLQLATVPVAYAIGRRLGGPRAGVLAAALLALSPLLVWFAQEARAYALLTLLGTLSVLLLLRAREAPTPRRLLAWGVVAGAALATHYFSLFLVAAEAAWLAWAVRPRARLAFALAPPLVAGLALLPTANAQRERDLAGFIADLPLGERLLQLPKQWLVGYDAPAEAALTGLAALLVAVALATGLRSPRGRRAVGLGALGLASVAIPVVLAPLGLDYVVTRNVLAALPVLLIALAVAAAASRAGTVALGALLVVWLAVVAGVAADPQLQREDWRGAARAIGPPSDARAVVVTPPSCTLALERYRPDLERAPQGGTAQELVVLALPRDGATTPPRPAEVASPVPGLRLVERRDAETFTLARFRAPAPAPLPQLTGSPLDPAAPGVTLLR